MIVGNISDKTQYDFISLNPKLKEALDYLTTDNRIKTDNDIDYFSDNSRAFINKINTRCFDNRFEAHKKHIDLFYILEGVEEVYVAATETAEIVKEYSDEKDVMFVESKKYTKITLYKGDYIILFPEDGHAPAIGDGSYLEKLVVKIKI